jgi:hypothetical protein
MTTAKQRAAARIVKRIYLGKPGGSMPLRVLQGVGAGLLTVVLVGAVVPNHKDSAAELSATSAHSSDSTTGESDAARRDRLAGEAAAVRAAVQNDFTALPEDPYRLDRDWDGIACES